MGTFSGTSRKYGDRAVQREGRIDGRLGIPAWEAETLPPFLVEVWQAGNAGIGDLLRKWKRVDAKLHAAWASRFAALTNASNEVTGRSSGLADAERRFSEERSVAPPPTDSRGAWYVVACLVMGLAELPFNEIAFRAAGESEAMTLTITAALAFAVVLGAHWLGIMVRRRQRLAATVLGVAVLAVIGGVAAFRCAHMASQAQSAAAVSNDDGGDFDAR